MSRPRPRIANDSITFRIPQDIKFLAEQLAKSRNISLTDFVKQAVMDALEDEHDLEAFRSAYEEYQKDPKLYTLDEALKVIDSGEEI